MYIAFKWLFCLTVTMWMAMCCIDVFVKTNIAFTERNRFNIGPFTLDILQNRTIPVGRKLIMHTERFKRIIDKNYNMAYWHFLMFVAGALVVSVYNNFDVIILITKRELINIIANINTKRLYEYLRIASVAIGNITRVCFIQTREKIKYITYSLKNIIHIFNFKRYQKQRINLLLLKKLKEINEERKHLAQLLLAAIRENKNVRMQYQLENMAKNRLVRHIENTEKVIKDNRSRYINFQQLYLVTHQENCFLKSRLKKITKDKEEVDKNLMDLISEVYKSKNGDLKSYCSRFIVNTKRNLLNTDIGAEIKKLLNKPTSSSLNWQSSNSAEFGSGSWVRCSSSTDCGDIITNEALKPLLSESPKLKGLPGECVWTVKDKDGLIEKLYECDYGSEFDTGDTIRRIREYSVYHDKDCLLDFSTSSSTFEDLSNEHTRLTGTTVCSSTGLDSPRQKFLTGSEAFKKFMQSNDSIVSKSLLLQTPRLLSD